MSLPPSIHVVSHPLVQHKLTKMRDKETSSANFRRLLREIGLLLGYDATRDLPLVKTHIETPVAGTDAPLLDGKKLVIVPILRAGLGLAEGVHDLVPLARVGHVGLYRDPLRRPPEGDRRTAHQGDLHPGRRARRPRLRRGPSRRAGIHSRRRCQAQRPRVYCPRPW